MDIAILGAGAMGCVYGGFLSESGENKVTLIDIRQDHIAAVNERGLIINTVDGEKRLNNLRGVRSAAEAGPADLVIVFVKALATETAMGQALNLIKPETMVLTMQNGLGNVEKLCRVVKPEQVIGGISSFGAAMSGPGEVSLRGVGESVFGELDGRISPRLENLKRVFDRAGLRAGLTNNVLGRIWTKLISNLGLNAPCALLNFKNGQLLDYPETEALTEAAVREAVAVAQAEGIRLETDDPIAYARKVIKNTGRNTCSMLQDIMAKRQTEITVINGAVVELGRKHGIPTPVNMVLTNLVRALEKSYLARAGEKTDLS